VCWATSILQRGAQESFAAAIPHGVDAGVRVPRAGSFRRLGTRPSTAQTTSSLCAKGRSICVHARHRDRTTKTTTAGNPRRPPAAIFTCCHPASRSKPVALTLRRWWLIRGDCPRVSRAERHDGQRLVRANGRFARQAYRTWCPRRATWPRGLTRCSRDLPGVQRRVRDSRPLVRTELCAEAIRLARADFGC